MSVDAIDIRYELFADGIANGKTVLQAALDAGYSEKSAQSQGSRLLRNRKVIALIEAKRKAARERHAVTVERILQELARIGFADITQAFSDDGTARKSISDIPEELRRAITGVEVEELFEMQGEGRNKERVHVGNLVKLKFAGKTEALRLMGQHLEMFTEKHKHEFSTGLARRLADARGRAHAGRG